MRVYDVEDAPMDRLLLLVPGQTPNLSFVAPVLDLRGERGDFGALQDGFVTTVDGFLVAAAAGRYEFRLLSDDGSTLSLDGQLVVDADGLHSGKLPHDGAIDLTAGEHVLHARHFEYGGDEQLTLEWKPPGAAGFALVPTSALCCQAGEVRVTSPGDKQLIHPL
ncbi:MAG TPA: PA14 domain-containing protein, partial [Planctomycetota bacterium]|nr:PA14 domain-containing protein [Planctomycetota bacterium]